MGRLVPGAVITGLIRLAVGGSAAPIQVVGWVLMIVAVGALIARPLTAGSGRPAIGAAA